MIDILYTRNINLKPFIAFHHIASKVAEGISLVQVKMVLAYVQ